MEPRIKSPSPALPLLAMTGLLIALLLLDLAFDATPEVLASFVPAIIWAGILILRGRR
jgi:hypothetical protein